jgi:hypothetical protein
LIVVALVLAAGLIISTWVVSGALIRTRGNETITVKGYAEQPIVSDLATWTGSFSVEAAQLVGGYSQLQDDSVTVRGFLLSLGVPAESIKFSSVRTEPLHRRDANGRATNDIERYRLSRTISLQSSDLALVQTVAARSTELIQDGVEFSSDQPQFFYTRLEDRKINMLGEAMRNAMDRARALATNSGASVGRLIHASQGVFQITPPNTTDVSDSGYNDTSTVDKIIKAVITAEFAID